MNNNLQKIKYIILGVVFIFSGFLFTPKASAITYTYNCNDGGTISSTVNLSSTGPFSADTPTPFQATAFMASNSCGDRSVYITAQNNNGSVDTLISQQFLFQNSFIPQQSVGYTSPSEGGDYNVNFTTWVNEPGPFNYSYNSNLGAIMGICHIAPGGGPGYFTATRDSDTEQDATSRGVTSVKVGYQVTTDNQNYFVSSIVYATFYPGELSVDVPEVAGGINHDEGGYCSAIIGGDGFATITVEEFY